MFDDQEQDDLNNENLNESLDLAGDDNNQEPSVEETSDVDPVSVPTPDQFNQLNAEDINTLPSENLEPIQYNENNTSDDDPVTVQPVRFASFDEEENIHGNENRNLDLLMNVNLQMSVELGRTELPFKKVLELTRGSIISLDKLAGEPVELFANGKLVAFGEVVVIEDNFGLRITSIAAPEERLKTVHEGKDK